MTKIQLVLVAAIIFLAGYIIFHKVKTTDADYDRMIHEKHPSASYKRLSIGRTTSYIVKTDSGIYLVNFDNLDCSMSRDELLFNLK